MTNLLNRKNEVGLLRLLLLLPLCVLGGCSDDASSMFSNREYVYCYFDKLQYNELNLVMGNLGQYASIRKHVVNGVTKITMTSPASSTDYNLDALAKNFGLGLGGLIVGTSNAGEPLCYDLACPICDRADRRLTLSNDGYAKCNKCGVTYRLEDGTPYHVPDDADIQSKKRGLYRYRINYDGQKVNPHN